MDAFSVKVAQFQIECVEYIHNIDRTYSQCVSWEIYSEPLWQDTLYSWIVKHVNMAHSPVTAANDKVPPQHTEYTQTFTTAVCEEYEERNQQYL